MCTQCLASSIATVSQHREKNTGQKAGQPDAHGLLRASSFTAPCHAGLQSNPPAASIFSGYQIDGRVFVSWGQYTVVSALDGDGEACLPATGVMLAFVPDSLACWLHVRIPTAFSLMQAEAERRLIINALMEPRNQRFVLVRQVQRWPRRR